MKSPEPVRLQQVLQTVEVLETVVLRAFGPHGGQVLFTRDTGQTLLSRQGALILRILRLDSPLARIIVDCASTHAARTGDGSKTFVLLLASLLRTIAAAGREAPPSSCREDVRLASARRLTDELLRFSSQRLEELVAARLLPHGQRLLWPDFSPASHVRKLLSTFFHTRLGFSSSCGFLSELLCELLSDWTLTCSTGSDWTPVSALRLLVEAWPAVHTPAPGLPLVGSRLVEGQVIHRDLTAFSRRRRGPVRAVVLAGPIRPRLRLLAGQTMAVGNDAVSGLLALTEASQEQVFSVLQSLEVSVLLSSVPLAPALSAAAARAELAVVEAVSDEELALFTRLSGAEPVSDCRDIRPEHVVSLQFCKPILLGDHRYVHVGFPENQTFKPRSLVLCGAEAEQQASALQDALRMLLMTWQPPAEHHSDPSTSAPTWQPPAEHHRDPSTSVGFCRRLPGWVRDSSTSESSWCLTPSGFVIAAGGAFEILLSDALRQTTSSGDVSRITASSGDVCRILSECLLCVPRHIYSKEPRRLAQVQTEVLKCIKEPERSLLSLDLGLELVSSKLQLLRDVLRCSSQLLHLQALVHTHRLRTISCRNTSQDDSDSNG